MRSYVMMALLLLGIWVAVTGILDSDLHVMAVLLLCGIFCVHAWYNRKPMIQGFKGLGWRWVLVGIAAVVMLLTTSMELIADHGWQTGGERCDD